MQENSEACSEVKTALDVVIPNAEAKDLIVQLVAYDPNKNFAETVIVMLDSDELNFM